MSALIAVASLIVALLLFSQRLDLIQQSRIAAATDDCHLFRAVIISASIQKGNSAAGYRFLANVGLTDCVAYGRAVTRVK